MTLISSTIPNLINGVSQQPDVVRLPSQGAEQINGMSSVVDGLCKRPPTEWVDRLFTSAPYDMFVHTINRDAAERYKVMVFGGDLKVYDLVNRAWKPVNFPDGKAYLAAPKPREGFAAVTVAEYTILTNKTVKTAVSTDTTDSRPSEALVHVRAANYAKHYKITVRVLQPPGAVDGEVTNEADLPVTGVSIGDIYKVTRGTAGTADDAYFVYSDGKASGAVYGFVALGYGLYSLPTGYPSYEQFATSSIYTGYSSTNPEAAVKNPVVGRVYYRRKFNGKDSYNTYDAFQYRIISGTVAGSPGWTRYSADKVVDYLTPDGDPVTEAEDVATTAIAEELKELLVTELGATDWNIERVHSTLHIVRLDGAKFSIETEDGAAGSALIACKDEVSRFSELPSRAPDGFVVRVAGGTTNDAADYYVAFKANADGTSDGAWRETVAPAIGKGLDRATMPHGLIREADGTFTFKRLEWAHREVGDDTTNAIPSVSGREVNDVFFHRNRLGLLAGESVVLSRNGDYFNLFRETTQQLLDTDPIDIASTNVDVAKLLYAVPFEKQLVLFTDKGQLTLVGGEILTPKNADIIPTTAFETATTASPVAAGKGTIFATPGGRFAGLREYLVDAASETTDALDISGHVPKFIPKGVFRLAASSAQSILLVLSEGAPSSVFVYQYYWVGSEKLQSAHHRWDFPDGFEIVSLDFIETTVWIVLRHADGSVHIERMEVEPSRTDAASAITYHLDRRVLVEPSDMTFNPATNQTIFHVPYSVDPTTARLVVAPGSSADREGVEVDVAGVIGTSVAIRGDWTEASFYFGSAYEWSWTFSTLFYRSGQEPRPVLNGRLQLRYMSLAYSNTGYVEAHVTPKGRDRSYKYVLTGRVTGAADTPLDTMAINSGTFRFPVKAENTGVSIRLSSSSHLPLSILSAEWEGFYNTRSKSI